MKLVLFSLYFFPLIVVGQINYEKGFFIDHDGNKLECLIKNRGWKNNPDHFEYKLSKDGESKTMDISSIKEFGIDNFSKYVSKVVKIDRSSDELDSLSSESSPIWSEEQLLLKVLVEGKASLYFYQNGNLVRFFYTVNGPTVRQLIYKKYLISTSSIGVNSYFQRQLLMDVKCGQATSNSVRNISYSSHPLVRYFNKYNECNGEKTMDLSTKVRGSLNLKMKTAIEFATYRLAAVAGPQYFDLGPRTNFRVGLEAEYVLPLHRNKWSILIDPAYQHYSGVKKGWATANYKSIEIPLGVRHYFFLGNKAKLFLNIFFVVDSPFGSEANSNGFTYQGESSLNFAFGGGFSYGRFGVEFRDYPSRTAPGPYGSYYQKTSVLLGFRLF